MPQVLVFGKNGQLAQALARCGALDGKVSLKFIGSSQFNLDTQLFDIYKLITKYNNIDAVINAAAYTNVDRAETSGCEQAYRLNALAPEQIAKACNAINIPLLHISTDCVFDGNMRIAYKPKDKASPINFYGQSKLDGEIFIRNNGERNTTFRTSWVFSPQGQNFFGTMLRLAKEKPSISVVNDQIGSPTYADHLAKALLHACQTMIDNPLMRLAPIYHIAGTGTPVSRYEFASKIFETAKLKIKLNPISSDSFGAAAQRPTFCALDTESFEREFDYKLPNWQDGLRQAISQTAGWKHEYKKRDYSSRRQRHTPLPNDIGAEQTAHAHLRQAYDLLPA